MIPENAKDSDSETPQYNVPTSNRYELLNSEDQTVQPQLSSNSTTNHNHYKSPIIVHKSDK